MNVGPSYEIFKSSEYTGKLDDLEIVADFDIFTLGELHSSKTDFAEKTPINFKIFDFEDLRKSKD